MADKSRFEAFPSEIITEICSHLFDPRDVLRFAACNRFVRGVIDNAGFFRRWLPQQHDIDLAVLDSDLKLHCVKDNEGWWRDETFWRHWGFPCSFCWGIESCGAVVRCLACDQIVEEHQSGRTFIRASYGRSWIGLTYKAFKEEMERMGITYTERQLLHHVIGVTRLDVCYTIRKPYSSNWKCLDCHTRKPKAGCISVSCGVCCTSAFCGVHRVRTDADGRG